MVRMVLEIIADAAKLTVGAPCHIIRRVIFRRRPVTLKGIIGDIIGDMFAFTFVVGVFLGVIGAGLFLLLLWWVRQ